MQEYWLKQSRRQPLFDNLLWSRPENKSFAGKLLVVGGNRYGFVAPAAAFKSAGQAGAGSVRMVLPDSLRPYVGKVFEAGELAPATPSGSLSQKALATILDNAVWADAILLAGDFGRNSETAILLEKLLDTYQGPLTLVGDSIDYFLSAPTAILTRPDTLLALDFPQTQKLFTGAHYPQALTHNMDRVRLVEALHGFSKGCQAHVLVAHDNYEYVAVNGRVSSTPAKQDTAMGNLERASAAAVWWLQNPSKPFEAISTSLVA